MAPADGPRQIDRKFHITPDGKIADSDGELLPEDEPLFLLRGRDALAVETLRRYLSLSRDGLLGPQALQAAHKHKPAGLGHQEAMHLIIAGFIRYQRLHPELVHVPGGSDNDDFSWAPMPVVSEA